MCLELSNEPSHKKTNNMHMRKQRPRYLPMRKQKCSNCTADQCLCFHYTENPTFQASSFLLWQYRSFVLDLIQKSDCWFSLVKDQICLLSQENLFDLNVKNRRG